MGPYRLYAKSVVKHMGPYRVYAKSVVKYMGPYRLYKKSVVKYMGPCRLYATTPFHICKALGRICIALAATALLTNPMVCLCYAMLCKLFRANSDAQNASKRSAGGFLARFCELVPKMLWQCEECCGH